ncbi:hypothetical protein [Haloplanus aerogenes]|nr:hypothetical protein [Haloplanus aerogenes]AZH25790.1 hypothetical protein DU502_10550 [Haloplanus aerogenes]
MSLGFGYAVLQAAQGASVWTVFVSGLPTWGCYLVAHYLVTGRFVDPGSESRELSMPPAGRPRVAFLCGVALMITGPPVGIYGMHVESAAITSLATAVFLVGYYTAHVASTGRLL